MRVIAGFNCAAAVFYFLTRYLFLSWFCTRKGLLLFFALIAGRAFCLCFPIPVWSLGNLQGYALSTKVYPRPLLKSEKTLSVRALAFLKK